MQRFIDAQKLMYDQALGEIKAGRKYDHWIWFIFPQMKGLGRSPNSHYFGIRGLEEAKDYYAHPVLGARLKEVTQELLKHDKSAEEIFGWLDAKKVCSCMKLFLEATGDEMFGQVLDKFYKGRLDPATLRLLESDY